MTQMKRRYRCLWPVSIVLVLVVLLTTVDWHQGDELYSKKILDSFNKNFHGPIPVKTPSHGDNALHATEDDKGAFIGELGEDEFTSGDMLALESLESAASSEAELYISYLPHSGFNNQKISFDNAVWIAIATNRTLILPPIYLFSPYYAITWHPFQLLQSELRDFEKYVNSDVVASAMIDWTVLYNLESLCEETGLRYITAEEATRRKLRPDLSIWDNERYATRIVDSSGRQPCSKCLVDGKEVSGAVINLQNINLDDGEARRRYFNITDDEYHFARNHETLQHYLQLGGIVSMNLHKHIVELAALDSEYKYVQFGSVFGSHRIKPFFPESQRLMESIRNSTNVANKFMLQITKEIAQQIRGNGEFFGYHFRANEGEFLNPQERVKKVKIAMLEWLAKKEDASKYSIYISTDVTSERLNEFFGDFFKQNFRSVYTWDSVKDRFDPSEVTNKITGNSVGMRELLSEFDQNTPFSKYWNGSRKTNLDEFIVSFMDMLIAGSARHIFGTLGSTYTMSMFEVFNHFWADRSEEHSIVGSV